MVWTLGGVTVREEDGRYELGCLSVRVLVLGMLVLGGVTLVGSGMRVGVGVVLVRTRGGVTTVGGVTVGFLTTGERRAADSAWRVCSCSSNSAWRLVWIGLAGFGTDCGAVFGRC